MRLALRSAAASEYAASNFDSLKASSVTLTSSTGFSSSVVTETTALLPTSFMKADVTTDMTFGAFDSAPVTLGALAANLPERAPVVAEPEVVGMGRASSICSYNDSTELPDSTCSGLSVGMALARREMFLTASCEPFGFFGDQALPNCCSSIFSPGQLIVRKMSPSRLPGGSPFIGGCV